MVEAEALFQLGEMVKVEMKEGTNKGLLASTEWGEIICINTWMWNKDIRITYNVLIKKYSYKRYCKSTTLIDIPEEQLLEWQGLLDLEQRKVNINYYREWLEDEDRSQDGLSFRRESEI